MKLEQFVDALELEKLTPGSPEASVEWMYCGDLLSHAMSELDETTAWATIQRHLNVAAVSGLKEIPLLIICDTETIPEQVVAKCRELGICLCLTGSDCFSVCGSAYCLLKGIDAGQG